MPFKRIYDDYCIITAKISDENDKKLVKIQNKYNLESKEDALNFIIENTILQSNKNENNKINSKNENRFNI